MAVRLRSTIPGRLTVGSGPESQNFGSRDGRQLWCAARAEGRQPVRWGGTLSGCGRQSREVNGEGCALTYLGMDVQGALGFPNESLNNGQPQAGALPGALGGEVGLED